MSTPFTALTNDLWSATFPVDEARRVALHRRSVGRPLRHLGLATLRKRLAAQARPDPAPALPHRSRCTGCRRTFRWRCGSAPTLDAAAARAKGCRCEEAHRPRPHICARLPTQNLAVYYDRHLATDSSQLVAKYPDLSFATKYPIASCRLWVDRERARFSTWYELFPRSARQHRGSTARCGM